jgi:hypothetical protein
MSLDQIANLLLNNYEIAYSMAIGLLTLLITTLILFAVMMGEKDA